MEFAEGLEPSILAPGMLYTESLFLVFFGVVWAVTMLLRPWPALKEWVLIAFSLFVIASWGWFDLALFCAVLAFNFWAAKSMSRNDNGPNTAARLRGGQILVFAIVVNVGTLALFKYANFFTSNLNAVGGWKLPSFPLGIPLAISFYVFHLISYLVDVHAGRVRLATVREYIFYLSFFPHVIAGPIVRAWQLVPQIGKRRRIGTGFVMGMHLLVSGFFLKVIMANNIARVIDPIWDGTSLLVLSACDRWIVAFLYYCQIYADFAGYTLMALGMARLLGYRLPANFRSPMRAASMQEFWRRWHITLSRWLRDYLYIPLGGNRGSRWRVCFNLMATMLLGGFWHGAGWGFVLWGAMQGAGLVVERLLGVRAGQAKGLAWIIGLIATQLWITLAWVFFRAPDPAAAWAFLWRMIPFVEPTPVICHLKLLLMLGFALPVVAHNWLPLLLGKIPRRSLAPVLGLMTGVLLVLNIVIYAPSKVFIYFRF